MAVTQSFTGRQGSATINGVFIAITRWTAQLHREYADSTDSNNYDAATGQIYQSQAPGVIGIDGTIEGNIDLTGIVDAQVFQKFKTDGPYPMLLSFTRAVNFCSGNFDYTTMDTTVQVPGATMVTFTANFKSNGVPIIY
jgi:hypothetical protein